jgi:hypothetical protein
MKKQLINLVSFMFLLVGMSTIYTVQAQPRYNRNSDRQVINLLTSIESKTSAYKSIVDRENSRGGYNNNRNNEISSYVIDFATATRDLRQKLNSRQQVSTTDVEVVLNRANFIENYMRNNRQSSSIQSQWNSIKTDVNSLARYYNITWDWNTAGYIPDNPNITYQVSEGEVRTLLNRLENRTDSYRREVSNALNNSSLSGTQSRNTINTYIAEFENATDRLKNKFNSRTSVNTDVQEVLNRAGFIDGFMRDNRLNTQSQNQWNLLKTDLNTLANYYNVSWNWNNPYSPNPNDQPNRGDIRFTGTYQLNVSQSDDVRVAVDRAINNSNYNSSQRDRIRQNLERRLTSPEMLAIERVNRQITIASSTSPQVVITADGVAKTEQNPNGRTVTTKAETSGDGVTISYEGDRVNDFYVSFMPMNNGQLKVTRRIYLENANETITVSSIYDKTSQTANWSVVNNGNSNAGYNNDYSNDFIIPNGTKINAVLTSELSTKSSVDGDKFTMEVRSPSQYRGAIIEGHVSNPQSSGRVTGRAELSLVFDRIILRNGRTYRYSGLIDDVRSANGEVIKINNEGVVKDSNQTTKTITRAGIGAGIGAIIGAIAGGGKGAAIGAVIGGGAGAGSVVLQGSDNLELKSGTEFNLTSSSPANTRASY